MRAIAVAVASAALVGAGAGVAHAGVLDGTVNNADVVSDIGLLNGNINADPNTREIRNANSRADGNKNNSTSQ